MLEITLPLPIIMWGGTNIGKLSTKSIHFRMLIPFACHYHSPDESCETCLAKHVMWVHGSPICLSGGPLAKKGRKTLF